MTAITRNSRRTIRGVVASAKGADTITVVVEQLQKHPKYGKFVRRTKKYMAHDPGNTAQPGDTVELSSTRPISKRKRWRLVRIVERSRFGEGTELIGGEA